MLPDGAHNRDQDWTFFFLNQVMPEVCLLLSPPFSLSTMVAVDLTLCDNCRLHRRKIREKRLRKWFFFFNSSIFGSISFLNSLSCPCFDVVVARWRSLTCLSTNSLSTLRVILRIDFSLEDWGDKQPFVLWLQIGKCWAMTRSASILPTTWFRLLRLMVPCWRRCQYLLTWH